MELGIGGGAYKTEGPLAVQECLNMYPQVSETATRSRMILKRFPGLTVRADLGGACNGASVMNGIPYFLMGNALCSFNEFGSATLIGNIYGGRVSMANNGVTMVIVNGVKGWTLTGTTLTQITDADFLPADLVFYFDTYFVFKRTGSNEFFISAAGDATAYNALDFATKEGGPGKIISMIVNHRDLVLLGEETIEYWRNTGNADFPFERQEGTFQERGCAALNCVAEMDNTYYFLGEDLIIYKAEQYRPTRISHHALEQWLSAQTKEDIKSALGFAFTHQGHYWYALSLPQGTWVYDSTTSQLSQEAQWFQLKSENRNNWRVTDVVSVFGKTWCGGSDGNVYELDATKYTENEETMTCRRATRTYFKERERIGCSRLELVVSTGLGHPHQPGVTQGLVWLEISKDGGITWGNPRIRPLDIGNYKQKLIWRRNGESYDWVYRWTLTDPVDVSFIEAYADYGIGE